MSAVEVDPGTVVVYADVGCPWAHVCVARLHAARAELALEDRIRIEPRAFALEVINGRPTPWPVLRSELPVAAALEPRAGWQRWRAPDWQWPVSTLLALEAVQAAREQGSVAVEQLDRALRVAMFAESRCVTMRHVVLDVARACPDVDEHALGEALDDGRARHRVLAQHRAAVDGPVQGSPHVFLPDGTDAHNPGISLRWEGRPGAGGVPRIEADDPTAARDLVRRARP